MQLGIAAVTRRIGPISLLVLSFVFAPTSASAALSNLDFQIKGPGIEHAGRELTVSFSATNAALGPTTTPEALTGMRISSHSISFNGDSDSVTTCQASLPKNGDPAKCPKSSRVGGGRVSGILGTPGQATDVFGPLSFFNGKFKLFNYKHPRGQPARMVAVITSTSPFGGVAINLVIPVSSKGVVSVKVPPMSKLPPIIRNSYPNGTQLVLTEFSTDIVAPRRKRSKPFLWLRTPGQSDWQIAVTGG